MSRVEERNKTLVQRAAQTHNARDRDGFLECYADELIVLDADGEGSLVVTPEEHWQAVLAWEERFEGFAEEIRDMVADGDLVFLRSRYSGIHRQPWLGVEPTNRRVEWDAWQILRLENGRIIEERMLMDVMSLFRQLGVNRVPSTG